LIPVISTPWKTVGLLALTAFGTLAAAPGQAQSEICMECVRVRVGPPVVVRGPFPDELDAPFTALKLADGSFRAFSANGSTYAIEGPTLWDLDGPRREVIQGGAPGSINDCGSWLTSTMRDGDLVLGFVHQEHACDYNQGRTYKSMAIASSADEGLTWNDLGTVITGTDTPQPDRTTGEGDCTMVDGFDGYLYAYCLRNSDWQTIVARAPLSNPDSWRKYHEGLWDEPGLGGRASDIGFIGTGAGYLKTHDWVAAVANDTWFGGLRLSLSADKVNFLDLDEPLLTIDGSDWDRPAETDLIAYATIVNPADGSNMVSDDFLLSYIYVPPGKGFESRYLVHHDVSLSVEDQPMGVQVGMALTRWSAPDGESYITSSGPLTGDRLAYSRDAKVADLLTHAPEGIDSIKLAECSSVQAGHLDHILDRAESCAANGYMPERTAGWLYAAEQPGTVPVYRCLAQVTETHFASSAPDCEGLGQMESLLGYGLAP
jgi:hypothetical protein